MRKFLLTFFLFALFLAPITPLQAQSSICTSSPCTAGEVGPFMKGISAECGNAGTCELADIMLVFSNVADWILGVVGAVVLLIYVVGGMYYIVGKHDEGKKMIKGATVGLLIVFLSYTGIFTLRNALVGGEIGSGSDYIICDSTNDGDACGPRQECNEGICESLCLIKHPRGPGEPVFDCVDNTLPEFSGLPFESGLCPGGAEIRCTQLETP